MQVFQLSDSLSVSGQVSVQDVEAIAAAGFKVLINNRPDHEAMDQPDSSEIAIAAQRAGLDYYHMPITAGDFPGPDVKKMASLLDDPAKPVMAFCRTGTRCANLWVWTRPKQERESAIATARQYGFDLSMAGSNT